MHAHPLTAPTVIVGGGLAGLSTLYHYPGFATLYEKGDAVGGTARSYTVGGFTFDYTGHLLHLHNPYTTNLVKSLLGENLRECQRNAWIFSNGVYTRYPFQANLYGLPTQVVQECLEGFRGVQSLPPPATSAKFSEWAQQLYGSGIYRHFMAPYNRKLFGTVDGMTAEWCGQFVPRVKLEEVERGAVADVTTAHGYNTSFFYPKVGGIQVLAEALAAPRRKSVHLSSSLKTVYWRSRVAVFEASNREVSTAYGHLVSTIPLPELLRKLDPFPAELVEPLAQLHVRPITCINLGVKRPNLSDKSWVYFPEDKFDFYRAGFPGTFSGGVVPEGCSSVYVEIGGLPNWNAEVLTRIRSQLIEARILEASDDIVVASHLPIKYAYVLYTPERAATVAFITEWLRRRHITLAGRYSEHKYSFMEAALLDGKREADALTQLYYSPKVSTLRHRV